VSVCAPSSGAGGRGILTADVGGTFSRNGVAIESGYAVGAFTDTFGGTSSATPLVAGICALLLALDGDLTAAEVKSLIQRTARRIGPAGSYGPNGHSPSFGYGCIDASAAVREVLTP
jgi:subtilisin family serine protease